MAFTNARGVAVGDGLADQVQTARFSAETLLGTLKDAETGQRGYLLTGDPSYLQPYRSAKARLKNDFARLEASTFDTDTWAAGVRRLRVLADAKLAELGATVALRQAGNLDGTLAIVRTDVGKR